MELMIAYDSPVIDEAEVKLVKESLKESENGRGGEKRKRTPIIIETKEKETAKGEEKF